MQIVALTNDGSGHDYETNPPASDGTKIVFNDSDHSGAFGFGTGLRTTAWPWKSFTRAVYPILLDCDFTTCARDSDPTRTAIKVAMAQVLTLSRRIDLASMIPETGREVFSTGYGLYSAGREYVRYMPSGGSKTINLANHNGTFTVEYFNPATEETQGAGNIAGNGVRTFSPTGWTGETVVYLKLVT